MTFRTGTCCLCISISNKPLVALPHTGLTVDVLCLCIKIWDMGVYGRLCMTAEGGVMSLEHLPGAVAVGSIMFVSVNSALWFLPLIQATLKDSSLFWEARIGKNWVPKMRLVQGSPHSKVL